MTATTLDEVIRELQQAEAQTQNCSARPADLELLDSGECQVHGDTFKLSPEGENALARLITCPNSFYQSVPFDLRATLTNRLLQEPNRIRPEQIRVTVRQNQITGLSDAKLLELPATAVLQTALDAMPAHTASDDLEIRTFHLTDDTLSLEITSRQTALELRPGDLVSAGLAIYHSVNGSRATQVSTYMCRLVCRNGMLVPVCRDDTRLRVRRLDGSRFSRQEMLSNLHTICQLAWDQLSDKLQALRDLTAERINPEAILRDIIRRMRLSRNVSATLIQALRQDELGQDDSQMAVINALSRTGTHGTDLSQTLRRLLMEASGVLSQENVHRCPACLSIIYNERRN